MQHHPKKKRKIHSIGVNPDQSVKHEEAKAQQTMFGMRRHKIIPHTRPAISPPVQSKVIRGV